MWPNKAARSREEIETFYCSRCKRLAETEKFRAKIHSRLMRIISILIASTCCILQHQFPGRYLANETRYDYWLDFGATIDWSPWIKPHFNSPSASWRKSKLRSATSGTRFARCLPSNDGHRRNYSAGRRRCAEDPATTSNDAADSFRAGGEASLSTRRPVLSWPAFLWRSRLAASRSLRWHSARRRLDRNLWTRLRGRFLVSGTINRGLSAPAVDKSRIWC